MTQKTKDFIEKAKLVHGDKCDYSLVEYNRAIGKVSIRCKFHGIFIQTPNSHLNGSGCKKCSSIKLSNNKKVSEIDFIEKAKEKHNNNYDYSLVEYKGSKTKIKIICPEHGMFEQAPNKHLSGQGCPKCFGGTKSNTQDFIKKSTLIHGDKYNYSLVEYKDSKTKIKIICEKHGLFEQTPANHTHKKAQGCPKCAGSLMNTSFFIEKAKLIHGDKYNYSLSNYTKSSEKIKIICTEHGVFEQYHVHHLHGSGCPKCAGVGKSNTIDFINKAKLIHGDKYGYSLVDYEKAKKNINIICPIHGVFTQTPNSHLNGQGCSICNVGFSKQYKIRLINDLSNTDLLTMDAVELSIIIQQGKLPIEFRPLVNTGAETDERLTTLRELRDRMESEGVEETDDETTDINVGETETTDNTDVELVPVDDVDDEITSTSTPDEVEPRLPSINQIRDLHSLDNSLYAGMDEEAFESLIQYKLRKIWNSVLNNEVDLTNFKNETGGKYFTIIKDLFFEEYDKVCLIKPKKGYKFKHQPNLMQQLTVYRLLKNKYYGNWSGTGAGKTLSFILASRSLEAKLTVVIALNSTIEQTCKSIKEVYPDSLCFTDYRDMVFDSNKNNYLVLNYEKFQQEDSEEKFQSLTNNNKIDFIVVDEVHNAKQREEDNESIRRGVMVRLLGRARENDNLHVLAMSATPVINNLYEAKSLLSLMSGLEYNDLDTRRTIGNAIKVFQQLILNGLRFIPKYNIGMNELTGRNMSNLNIDGSHLLDELLSLPQSDYIGIEKTILTDKLKAITPYLRKGVIIYSYFTTDIINRIQEYVERLGFKVGTYTSEESTTLRSQNLKYFISGKIDILIGSRPIGTGVDGLQGVCNRMIPITLPWTDSEYTQLKGRIYRQGSEFDNVEIIIPQITINLEGDKIWSWDMQRLNLIRNKKTLADAAVDGVIPSNVMPSMEIMFRKSIESLKNWKERVESGNIVSHNRNGIVIDLYPEINDSEERAKRILSELSEFNRRGKTCHSSTTNKEFMDNLDSWFRYHALRKKSMESWEEIPYEYIATKIKDRRDVVADFGCGENLFKNCIPNNKVYSFDHIAIDESVIACDMRNTGLEDESIDVAVFSLALWGTNSDEYLSEAYRVLRRKGMIYISEPSKNYETLEKQEALVNTLNSIGFQQVGNVENRGKFIYISAIKI